MKLFNGIEILFLLLTAVPSTLYLFAWRLRNSDPELTEIPTLKMIAWMFILGDLVWIALQLSGGTGLALRLIGL